MADFLCGSFFLSIFCVKIPGALGVAEFERDNKFGNLFLAKHKTGITFAPVIRMTIVIYAFWVEKNFPYCDNRFSRLGFSKLEKSAIY